MTVSVEAARERAVELEAALQAGYAGSIAASGRRAARRFSRLATKHLAAAANPDWTPPDLELVVEAGLGAAAARKRTGKAQARMLEAVVAPTLERTAIAWDVTHPLSQKLLDQLGLQAERLVPGVRQTVASVIADAYERGLSVAQTASAIQAAVDGVKGWQAAMLARTDLVAVSNGGSLLAVRMLDAASAEAGEETFATKTWISAGDELVRETHQEADGQTVPLDQPFDVGGESLDYPGDPGGSDEETINCRCAMVFGEPLTAAATPPEEEPMSKLAEKPNFFYDRTFSGGRTNTTALSGNFAAAVTITVDEAESADAAAVSGWESPAGIAFENVATGDGRFFLPGSWGWRDLPLTLMAMVETGPGGHEGAEIAGRIDRLEKIDAPELGQGAVAVRAVGVFDSGEYGQDVARMVGDLTLRGISVDYSVEDYCFRHPDTGQLYEPDEMTEDEWMRAFMGELQLAARAATIGMATVCPFPAFEDAGIALTASGELTGRFVIPFEPTLAAGALTAAVQAPVAPPKEWFETPEARDLTPITITPDGRLYGHAATWNCHQGFTDRCVLAPRSQTGYAYFHTGELETAEGDVVNVGRMTYLGPHAPLTLNRSEAQAHYSDCSRVAAFVRARDGLHGVWVSGAVRSGLSDEGLRDFRANPPSGDWRGSELIALHAVPVAGLPVPRPEARLVASSDGEVEVAVLVAAGVVCDCDPVELADDAAFRTYAALADGGLDALAELAGVE